MAQRRTVAQLERALQYAKNKEAYKRPEKEQGTPTRKSPKIDVAYKPMQITAGDTAKRYRLQASQPSVTFFGMTALHLVGAGAEEPMPRGSQPAKVHAMVADATPTLVRAEGSKRPYIRYGRGTRESNVQYTFCAPISIQSATALDSEVKTLFNATTSKLGGAYGRVWFEPERFILTSSGT
ncbi:MAG: hypothetical protein KME46_32375 [Brasilonema angustatum HA4187-MV1]|jgi:hypothetical protein|nr:hypothetical protein [Brasilonema angustatum HA4187-MV1]